MLIGELAAASGLTREALRFYEQQGLLRARRLANGYRDYAPETLMLVNYIRTAQQLGFTLAEIGHKLPEIWEHAEPGPAITQVLQEKLHEIDARIIALQVLREDLATPTGTGLPAHAPNLGIAPRRHRFPDLVRRTRAVHSGNFRSNRTLAPVFIARAAPLFIAIQGQK